MATKLLLASLEQDLMPVLIAGWIVAERAGAKVERVRGVASARVLVMMELVEAVQVDRGQGIGRVKSCCFQSAEREQRLEM
jgi:hypothetical protein